MKRTREHEKSAAGEEWMVASRIKRPASVSKITWIELSSCSVARTGGGPSAVITQLSLFKRDLYDRGKASDDGRRRLIAWSQNQWRGDNVNEATTKQMTACADRYRPASDMLHQREKFAHGTTARERKGNRRRGDTPTLLH